MIIKPLPTLKFNALIKPAPINKMSKLMLYFFRFLHIVFSYDMGFFQFKSYIVKNIFRLISILQCISICGTVIYFLFVNLDKFFAIWYTVFIVQFIINVLILNLSGNKMTYYRFQRALLLLDSELKVDTSTYNFELKIILCIFVSISCRCLLTYSYCSDYIENCVKPVLAEVLYCVPWFSLDIVLIVYSSIFYSAYCRLVKLTSNLKNTYIDICGCQYLYISIVDATEQIKITFDNVFLVVLLIDFPEVMVSIYLLLLELKKYWMNILLTTSLNSFTIFQSLVLMFCPPLCANILLAQTEKMTIVLHNRLLQEKDKNRIKDIKRLIRYIEARPFNLKARGIIPLNASLPVAMLNFCVTYLIVAIQFSHLY
ncbi:hypothetical protein K1T71_012317 [Dendrolimus kikuchii]|uniref:Uncharacterized protein n=1 Tax=Dendrolimus kikuchii TaxID=765133 RepID=A0ACC1CLM8_9NEOP|nr:hypothetical protein K1T71_012317 [Dendrolimus kikuchii]